MLKSAIALTALFISASGVSAADFEQSQTFDWTGPYVGIQGGYAFGDTNPTFNAVSEAEVNFKGLVGGIEGGYNWQSDSLVFGVEGDISLSSANGNELGPNTPCIIAGIACSADVDWLSTGRLRVGYAFERLMPFISGGVALAGVKGTFDSPGLACTCSVDDMTVGWTVGGGLEWAIQDEWSAKLEYLYVSLSNPSIDGDNTLFTPGVGTGNYDFSVVRLGINRSF